MPAPVFTEAETEEVEAEQIRPGDTVLSSGWPCKVHRVNPVNATVIMETDRVTLRYWKWNTIIRVVKP